MRPESTISHTCEYCGETFAVPRYQLRHRTPKFCSLTCFHSNRGKWSEAAFWSRADTSNTGCWEWQRGRNKNGYGRFMGSYAHRIAYRLAHGLIAPGMKVCHTCDNPPCVNPAHLFLGTDKDNMADCRRKGRFRKPPTGVTVSPARRARGERVGGSRLTANVVAEIRRAHPAWGGTQAELAAQFGVSQTTIWNIIHRHTWCHIP